MTTKLRPTCSAVSVFLLYKHQLFLCTKASVNLQANDVGAHIVTLIIAVVLDGVLNVHIL